MDKAKAKRIKMLLPVINVVADEFKPDAAHKVWSEAPISSGMAGTGYWAQTGRCLAKRSRKAKTVVWNGPMGVLEMPAFAEEHQGCYKIVSEMQRYHNNWGWGL